MPVKELEFSFRITVEALAQALANSNHGVDIKVLGTPAIPLNDAEPKQLEPPRKGMPRELILGLMRKDPAKTYPTAMLVAFCANYGVSTKTVYSATYYMRKGGELRKNAAGWRLTKGAING